MTEQLTKIQEAVGRMRDPETGRPLSKTGQVGDITIEGSSVRCVLKLSTHSSPVADEFSDSVAEAIRAAAPDMTAVTMVRETLERPPARLAKSG